MYIKVSNLLQLLANSKMTKGLETCTHAAAAVCLSCLRLSREILAGLLIESKVTFLQIGTMCVNSSGKLTNVCGKKGP